MLGKQLAEYCSWGDHEVDDNFVLVEFGEPAPSYLPFNLHEDAI